MFDDKDIIVLAPMVRGSELAFRQMVRSYGVQHCYSPMLRSEEVVKAYNIWKQGKNDNTSDLQDPTPVCLKKHFSSIHMHEDGILLFTDICNPSECGRLTVQLCGSCPDTLFKATRALIELFFSSFDLESSSKELYGIDLNLGCPQKCAKDGGYGAFLAETRPELAIRCIQAMRRAIDSFRSHGSRTTMEELLPFLSAKIRLQDGDNEETISFAKMLEVAGCELLAIHCRRRCDAHSGEPDLVAGKDVANALSIPVVINGVQVQSVEDVHRTLAATQAHSVMVARAFLRNPKLLSIPNASPANLAAEYLDFCELYPPPSPLYIRSHLRWIFRADLEPKTQPGGNNTMDYKDWRARLWTFMVRPYLETIYQFRLLVALYANLSCSDMPESLLYLPDPSFQSVRHSREMPLPVIHKNNEAAVAVGTETEEIAGINLFQS
eukprot:scaffold5939_cov111-Cylindrotheca_fusiformis.AAC.4